MNYPAFTTYQMKTYDHVESRSNNPIIGQINRYLDYCANTRQMTKATMRSKYSALRSLVADTKLKDLNDLTNDVYDKFVKEERKRNVSARTINNKASNIIAFVKYWREMGINAPLKTPLIVKLKEQPPRRTCYTKDEIREVLENSTYDMQWLLIKIAFETGMRITEIRNLHISQINGRKINFIGKGTKAREVYLTLETYTRLMKYIEKNNIREFVWLNEWGYHISVDTIRRIMREPFIKCGHEDFYPHALRHSFGTNIQRQGATIFEIKEMMGHSNIATTQKYLHGMDGQLESLFDKYIG